MHKVLPVTVDIIAAKGCDLMIAQLAQFSVPLTGGTIYGDDIFAEGGRRSGMGWGCGALGKQTN
jgi:hypothetical protein